MFTGYTIITVIAIVANAASAIANFTRVKVILANMAELGIPQSWLPWLGALKTAGAAGLLLGLLGVRSIGVAAAAGLVLYYLGAVAAHFPRRVYRLLPFPGGYLALAVAALVLAVAE
ncbi:DoxX family protein [Streptomyces sp. NA02950]|uniref:DoxX family protein n=1 Tax=Streptomyces sp. NA02950 TaxID=2742137 RepID=UPI00158FB4AD|nr:DoxX family protein [Streptomyces sp. NA02950]QKV97017.1 DoxX family protein [Streptomyces sp. NA02950]